MSIKMAPISPKRVRYVKLGKGGVWEAQCIHDGLLRFGFWSGKPDISKFCRDRRWDAVKSFWLKTEATGIATRDTNELRTFVEDTGDTLWVTFVGDRLYWGFLEPGDFEPTDDDESSIRRIRGGWKCTDINGRDLTKANLSGAITKLAAYRGTSCNVDVAEKLVKRINVEESNTVKVAIRSYDELADALVPLIRSLHPNEFEDLVDLIFGVSGWRRIGRVGGTQKTVDFDLKLPSTQERAFVQVKSRTNQDELNVYVDSIQYMSADKMFFVYHTGDLKRIEDDRVFLIDGLRVAKMAIDAGLTDWIIEKAS